MEQTAQPTQPAYTKKEFWDERAEYYQDNNAQISFPASVTLSNVLNLQKAKNLIEVGCAAGTFSLYYLQTFNYAENFYSLDISSKFIELANKAKSKANLTTKTHHEYIVGTADDLNFLKDDSLDAYVSNLVIHLVPDANKMLQEAKRVLQKGGRIGLSVPMHDEGSLFALIMKSIKEAGWQPPQGMGNGFAYSNKEVLGKLLEDNGFNVEYLWKEDFRFPIYTDEDVEYLMNGDVFGGIFKSLSEDQKNQVRKNVFQGFAEMKKARTCPYMGTLSIVATKP